MTVHLEVNEAKILATRSGFAWWLEFRGRFEPIGRIEVVTASIGGDRVKVQCDDREHANWLMNSAIEHGVPKTALKVTA
jgi:hypothetical protein